MWNIYIAEEHSASQNIEMSFAIDLKPVGNEVT